jgi:hypothetical protein
MDIKESDYFFQNTLPKMQKLVLKLPNLIDNIKILKKQKGILNLFL